MKEAAADYLIPIARPLITGALNLYQNLRSDDPVWNTYEYLTTDLDGSGLPMPKTQARSSEELDEDEEEEPNFKLVPVPSAHDPPPSSNNEMDWQGPLLPDGTKSASYNSKRFKGNASSSSSSASSSTIMLIEDANNQSYQERKAQWEADNARAAYNNQVLNDYLRNGPVPQKNTLLEIRKAREHNANYLKYHDMNPAGFQGAALEAFNKRIAMIDAARNYRKYKKENRGYRLPRRKAVYADGTVGFGRYKKRSSSRYRRRIVRGRGAYISGMGRGNGVVDQDVPQVSNPHGTDGAVVIRHKEYIRDITSTTAFAIQAALRINPSDPITFPWLSSIAKSFTQYRFEGLIFKFVSTSGSLSTTQALGEIIQAVNYNPVETAFTNKQQMLNEVFAVSKVPAFDAECPVECDPKQSQGMGFLQVRNGRESGTEDPRFYDLGNYYLATQGQAAAAVTMGELHVTYQVALYKPQLQYPAVPYGTQILGGTTNTTNTGAPTVPQNLFPGPVIVTNTFGVTLSYGAVADRTRVTIPTLILGYNYSVTIQTRWTGVGTVDTQVAMFAPVSGVINYAVSYVTGSAATTAYTPKLTEGVNTRSQTYFFTATDQIAVIDLIWPILTVSVSDTLRTVLIVQPCTL